MEKVLMYVTDKMCVKPLSKIYDLTDKFTFQYMRQAFYSQTAMYHKINGPTQQFQNNCHIYSSFSMSEMKMKTVTSIRVHAKHITTFVR